MKLICAPKDYAFPDGDDSLGIILYDAASADHLGCAGAAVRYQIIKDKLAPSTRAWDFLSLALAVTAADLAGHRDESPDGWTREFDLKVATVEPQFWNGQRELVNQLLGFLTTDKWNVDFIDGGEEAPSVNCLVHPPEDSVVLLSGGLDSTIGAIDLVASGARPFAVSQIVRGDAENQRHFAQSIGGGLRHLQLNHNADVPDPENPPSQRARSLIFLAYGVLASTALAQYHDGGTVTLYLCENGFISVNSPLTPSRIGSLSTRTTHPYFLRMVRALLEAAELRVSIVNPYQLRTKGEMLEECHDQGLLRTFASRTVSCGRYKHFGYKHCGRCVPCLVRRAAFLKWGVNDDTPYIYEDLGRDDEDHSSFDDVRSVAMAIQEVGSIGIQEWIGTALSTATLGDVAQMEAMVMRGLAELESLLKAYGVK